MIHINPFTLLYQYTFQVECTAIDERGQVIDLSPLIKAEGHHLAVTTSSDTDTDSTYYINICRPLNPIDSILCPPMSSACRVRPNEKPIVRIIVKCSCELFPKIN